jgi:hypothetical protein
MWCFNVEELASALLLLYMRSRKGDIGRIYSAPYERNDQSYSIELLPW